MNQTRNFYDSVNFITNSSYECQPTRIQGFKKELYSFQASSIKAMEELEKGSIDIDISPEEGIKMNNNTFGILANQVGSGKTITILGFCKKTLNNPLEQKSSKWINVETLHNITTNLQIKQKINTNKKNIKASLIVVPHILIKQWIKELDQTNLRYLDISIVKINDMKDIVKNLNFEEYDIIIASSTKYNLFIREVHTLVVQPCFKRLIIDEADSIKISGATEPTSLFTWFVTATPDNLYQRRATSNGFIGNYSHRLYNYNYNTNTMVNCIYKSIITIKCCPDWISTVNRNSSFERLFYNCIDPLILRFSSFIDSNVLDLINSGNTEAAIESLGGNVESFDSIQETLISKINKEISITERTIQQVILNEDMDSNYKKTRLETLQAKKDSYKTRIESITEKIIQTKENKSSCSICLEEPCSNPTLVNCCNQIFCFNCITSWIYKSTSKCPFCRHPLKDLNDLTVLNDNGKKTKKIQKSEKKLSKEETIIKIIKNNPNGKYIIFSKHDATFRKISNILTDNCISYAEPKGRASTIEKYIKDLNDGKLQVLFLNSVHSGAGLNIPCADNIIIYHEMSKEMETQAIGRVLRINRPSNLDLKVHYLKYSSEYNN